jgi:hypothetical protein
MSIRTTAFEVIESAANRLCYEYQASGPEAYIRLLQAALLHVALGVMLSPGDDTGRDERLEMLTDIIETLTDEALLYTEDTGVLH